MTDLSTIPCECVGEENGLLGGGDLVSILVGEGVLSEELLTSLKLAFLVKFWKNDFLL